MKWRAPSPQFTITSLWLFTLGLLLFPYLDFSRGLTHVHLNFYSQTDEPRIGQDWAREFEKSHRLLKAPRLERYVQQVAEKIVGTLGEPDRRITVRIVDTEDVNALAIPGGFVYVNLGLLVVAKNESELASVLSHEIAHVVARHGTQHLSQRELIMGAVFLGGALSVGPLVAPFTGLVNRFGELAYSRGDEQQADDMGIDYLYLADFHPEGMATFFDTLWQLHEEKRLTEFFSSHPLSNKRAARARRRFSLWPIDNRWLRDSITFHEMKVLAEGYQHVALGRQALWAKKYSLADSEFEKAIALDPRNPMAYYWRAQLFIKTKMEDLAMRDIQQAIAVNPDLLEAYETLDGLFSARSEWDTIIRYWNAYLERNPKNGKAYYERGGVYFRKGDHAQALADAKTSCDLGYAPACQAYKKYMG
jgi:predicted Zn-dependent protease